MNVYSSTIHNAQKWGKKNNNRCLSSTWINKIWCVHTKGLPVFSLAPLNPIPNTAARKKMRPCHTPENPFAFRSKFTFGQCSSWASWLDAYLPVDTHTGPRMLQYPSALASYLLTQLFSQLILPFSSGKLCSSWKVLSVKLCSFSFRKPSQNAPPLWSGFSYAYLYICTLCIPCKLLPPLPYTLRLSNRKANIVSYLIW